MKALLLIPVLVMFISGCTIPGLDFLFPGGGVTYEGSIDVIVISSAAPIPSTVSSGQSTTIYADIQNLQEPGKDPIDIEVELYDYCENLFELEGDARFRNERLQPQQVKTFKWDLKAEEDINLKTTCVMKVRVVYSYKTEVVTQVTFMDKDELESRIRRGESWMIPAVAPTVGEGPVKPYLIIEDQQPISVDPMSDDGARISMQIKNVGSGFISGDGRISHTEIEIEPLPSGLSWKGKACNLPFSDQTEGVELIKKESSKKFCEIAPSPVDIQNTYTLRGWVEYDYEFRNDKINVIVSSD
jgi:hypothetical protein